MELSISNVGALSSIQWGINEVASSLFVAKHVGTLLSRKTDSNFFNVLEQDFHVKVRKVPTWIQNFVFPRRFSIRAQDFRQIDGDVCIDDVRIEQLQGFATLLVLCCRYALEDRGLEKMIEAMLLGGLGGVEEGKLVENGLPFTSKSLIMQFIRATVDSDKKSTQAQMACELMSHLLKQIDSPWKAETFRNRNRNKQYLRLTQFVSVLLGGASVEEELDKQMVKHFLGRSDEVTPRTRSTSGHRVFDTMSSDVAFVALAAAANGADVCVQCLCDTTEFFVPTDKRGAEFLVRFWLRQPPEHVSKMLRISEDTETATDMEARDDHMPSIPPTVFGGHLEVARITAHMFSLDPSNEADLLALWQKGFTKGIKTPLKVISTVSSSSTVQENPIFTIQPSKKRIKPSVESLSMLIQTNRPELRDFAREIGAIVDDVYMLTEYDMAHFPALQLVAIAITTGILERTTRANSGDLNAYAVNAAALEPGGDLDTFLPRLVRRGLPASQIVWTAATLWGGASQASQGHTPVTDGLLGVVAPHCNIVLDVIRDPLHFVQKGIDSNLLYMCRGSLPTIARSPVSGFITADKERHLHRANVQKSDVNNIVRESDAPNGDITIALEPDVNSNESFRSVFCCWYFGQLAFEVAPHDVFRSILMRGTEIDATLSRQSQRFSPAARRAPLPLVTFDNAVIRNLSWMEILSLEHFELGRLVRTM